MRNALLAAIFFVLPAPLTPAAEHWIHLTTPHFEMYTTNNAKQATAALNDFEQVRYFFLENSRSKTAPDAAVRIIAFRSEKEFKPYRMNEGAFAYYVRSRKVDYILMQDLNADHHQAALHEYTHLVVEHLKLNLPVWLNEGMADVYSSLEPNGDKALIGRPIQGRAQVLMTQRWLDWNTLFAVDRESPYYNERDKMSIFYAQSWALTHMLMLGKDYRPGFQKFLAEIAAGRPTADCLKSVYGKTLAQITPDLHAYLSQSTVQGALFNVKLSKSDLEPQVTDPSDFEVDLALDDLLASQKRTLPEASQRLSQLALAHPESADVQESLAYLAWEQGNANQAKDDFKLAYEKGSKDPDMLFNYSQLLHDSGAPISEILPVLQRAVTLKPDYTDAWFNLGLIALSDGQPGIALNALAHVTKVTPDRAFTLFSAQAYCYMQLKSPQQARAAALRAMPYANTPDQNLQISNLLHYLDSLNDKPRLAQGISTSSQAVPAPSQSTFDRPTVLTSSNGGLPRDVASIHGPPNMQHIQGVAKSFECRPKAARLHVMVNSEEKIFQLDDPDKIVVRNGNSGFFDISCGQQKPFTVDVFYVPTTVPGVEGSVLDLVF